MPRRQRGEKSKIRKADRKAAAKHRSKPKAKSEAVSSPACHFLRIPLGECSVSLMWRWLLLTVIPEIRHEIYGYLLLNPPSASLYSLGPHEWKVIDSDDSTYMSSDYGGSEFDDEMLAFSTYNPYGIEMGDMYDGMFNEVYNGGGLTGFGSDMFGDFDDQSDTMDFGSQGLPFSFPFDDGEESDNEGGRGTRFLGKSLPNKVNNKNEMGSKRHLAILRTNRQIYIEASALLHSDLTINVEPGDALIDTPGNATVERHEKLWRHAPSNRPNFAKINGQTVYNTPSLDGVLEPHVFAQFEKISYTGDFDFSMDDNAPSLHIDDNLRARAEDDSNFVSYLTATKNITRWCEDPLPAARADNGLRESLQDVADITISRVVVTQPSVADVIQKFVDLLSNSPVIRHLEFVLDVTVNCSNASESTDYDSEDSEQVAKEDEEGYIADERATELFLEAGVLDSLRTLSNVMKFSFTIETIGRGCKLMTLKKKHLEMVQDLKNAIEKNWLIKHGSR